ncbi:MAG: aminopeptidase, partial [Moraxellaceae bacterium]|nr:aminopeptidase [Moraxellaceae bacterium]
LIFHELAHQVLFVPGDTVFNESFAVAVADAGLQRYSARYPLDIARLQQARARRAEFVALVMTHRDRLAAQFAAAPTADAKRAIKAAIFADLRTDHAALKQRWGGYAGYDAWFDGLNNARLNAVSNYYELVPLFTRLLEQEGGDFARFFAACRMLARLDYASRRQRLAAMVAAPVEP